MSDEPWIAEQTGRTEPGDSVSVAYRVSLARGRYGTLGVIATRMDKQSAIEILRCSAIGIALCLGVVFFHKKTLARANTILQSWARQHDFELVHFERCFFTGGFSWLTTSGNQIVYFVTVRDRAQHERSGWVRCGSWASFIFFSSRAEVKWKDTP